MFVLYLRWFIFKGNMVLGSVEFLLLNILLIGGGVYFSISIHMQFREIANSIIIIANIRNIIDIIIGMGNLLAGFIGKESPDL